MGTWALFLPFLSVYARFFPRKADRVLFWTNEGIRVAPSRLRSYAFCIEMKASGVDADVLSFWDHLAYYQGLAPFIYPLHKRVVLLFRAMMAAVHSRAGVLVAQRPFYEFVPLVCLKLFYGKRLQMWTDVDDWIFDYSLEGVVDFRDTLPIHMVISEGCIVSSLHLDQEMRKYFSRVEIIPTFTDQELFKPSHDGCRNDGTVVFSWTGTLFMEMNLYDVVFLVESLESLHDDRIVLHIVGAGEFLDEARRRAGEIAKHVRVEFLGWKEPHTMPEYYADIDVGLYALTVNDDFSRSKSPTKVFEYMACGKPTVATNLGEAPRFIEHGVTGFVADGQAEFAEYCGLLAADRSLRETMGRNARNRIETDMNVSRAVERLGRIINVPV